MHDAVFILKNSSARRQARLLHMALPTCRAARTISRQPLSQGILVFGVGIMLALLGLVQCRFGRFRHVWRPVQTLPQWQRCQGGLCRSEVQMCQARMLMVGQRASMAAGQRGKRVGFVASEARERHLAC